MSSLRALVQAVAFDRVPNLVRRGPRTARRVAITFDDGPDDFTERLLDGLDDLGIPATFFLRGERAEARPDLVRAYLRRGHQIASHGHDHARFDTLTPRAVLAQCKRTDAALGGQPTGRPWVRPPHGALGTASTLALLAAGYTVALWSVDAGDVGDRDPASIAARCASVAPGDVLRFHEGQPWTLDAVARVATSLHASGYECVTMYDLVTP